MIVVAIIGLLAAIATPGFARARVTAWRSACLNNLRQIDNAKQEWALEFSAGSDVIPAQSDLTPYIRGGTFPKCPGQGAYRIRRVSRVPVCNQNGHDLNRPDELPD